MNYLINHLNSPLIIIFSLIFCFPIAVLQFLLLPKKLRNKKNIYFFYLLWISNACLPIISIPCWFMLLIFIRHRLVIKDEVVIQKIADPDLAETLIHKISKEDIFGAKLKISSKNFSLNDRIQSLLALNSLKVNYVNALNRQMLHDHSDELRLYAFNLLNDQEQQIDDNIFFFIKKYQNSNNNYYKARVARELAFLYWQLVDLYLVEKELRSEMLQNAFNYLDKALAQLPDDIALWNLSGRLYLLKDDYEKAYQSFHKATELHADIDTYLPFISVIRYKNKYFQELKQGLLKAPTLASLPSMKLIWQYWCTKVDV